MASQIEVQALENAGRSPHNTARPCPQDVRLKNTAFVLCVVLAASLGFAAGAGATGRTLYKWVDEQGVTHYGDRIPPEYASQEQHIMNSQGVEINRLEAQKSAEQMATEEQKRQDVEQRQNRDRNLLNTYASVQEIERLRDQRLGLITDQIKVTSQFLETLNGKLKKLRINSMHFKPYSNDPNAPAMPDQVAEDLVRVGNDIHTQEQNLREKTTEETTMSKQFESDISRFKELKGIH
jgi:Domain of unknown function (DUF4124)